MVQESVKGLDGVPDPEAVRAVVPNVSVKVVVPLLVPTEIVLLLLSKTNPDPLPACSGAKIVVPDRAVTIAEGLVLTAAVYPEPSMAVPVPEFGGPLPQPKEEDQVDTATENRCATPRES